MKLTQEERQFLKTILIFYRHHHMSAVNPQQKDVDVILDKISKDIRNDCD